MFDTLSEVVAVPHSWLLLILPVVTYFLGCLNGAIMTSRLVYLDDVRDHGSHNAGLTNFYRTYGPKHIVSVILIDMGKAALSVLIGILFFSFLSLPHLELYGAYWGALFCVIGHTFPLTEHFRGGKGVLCTATIVLCLDWQIALIGWGIFAIVFLLTRFVSLASIVGVISFPISTTFVYHGDPVLIILAGMIAVLAIWAHRSNIARLLKGMESRFTFHPIDRKEKEE